MSTYTDLERDTGDLAKLVNEDTYVQTRYGGTKASYTKVINDLAGSFNLTPAFSFADGFTIQTRNQAGIDDNGEAWIYNGSLPFEVTAGTTPTTPTYTKVTFNSAGNVSLNNGSDVQSFADSFALKIFQSPTDGGLTEIQTRTVNAGEVYEVRKTSDDSLATIYSDAASPTEISQNGIDNISESDGIVEFYIDDGDYYIESGGVKSNFMVEKRGLDYFRTLQLINSGNAARKICVDEALKITCMGDSLTYGESRLTGGQPADTTPTQAGRSHVEVRADVTYPQRLQTSLQSVFSNPITVVNHGYSGDNTKNGYEDWFTSVDSDITLMMYGTNDAAEGFSPYQTIDNYIKYYDLIIQREMGFGSVVVIMLPPQQKQFSTNTRLLNAYRNAAKYLAEKYGCLCVDMAEATRGCDSTVFDDNVHFKSEGYAKIAETAASAILAKIESYAVGGNDSISVRIDESPIKYDFTKWGTQTAKSGQKSPPLTSFTGGYVIETNTYGAKASFSFYAESDDLIFQPSLYLQNADCLISLDNDAEQMQYSLDDKVQSDITGITDKPDSSKTISEVDSSLQYDRASPTSVRNEARIHISKRGWHTVSVELIDNGSSGSPLLTLWGGSFIDYDSLNSVDNDNSITQGAQEPSGNVTPSRIGELYLDTTSGQYEVYVSTGLTVNSWKLITLNINNLLRTGAQNPIGNVTPRFVGEQWLDISSGEYKWYQATGTGNTSWKQSTNEPITP